MTPLQIEVLEEFAEAQKLGKPQHDVSIRDRIACNEAAHKRRPAYDKKYNKTKKAKAAQKAYRERLKADPERYAAHLERKRIWRQRRSAKVMTNAKPNSTD